MRGFKPNSRSAKGACYADGGVVETLKSLFSGGSKPQQPAQAPRPNPEMLGSGMAADAGKAIVNHHKRLEEAGNYADGGVVDSIKGFLGFKPASQPATQAPTAKPTPEMLGSGMAADAGKAIVNHHKRLEEAGNYADGGPVRGPGTGTSDDVKKKVKPGTYIMPADSTAEIGEEALREMGEPVAEERTETLAGEKAEQRKPEGNEEVPVNLSNGEYELPPEQVHAIGVQMLDHMKDKTHTPVAARGDKGFKPENFFADGGNVGNVLRGTIEDMQYLNKQGKTAQAIGAGVRGSLATVPAMAADATNAAGAAIDNNIIQPLSRNVVEPVANFSKGLLGIDGTTAAPPAPSRPAATVPPPKVDTSPQPSPSATVSPAAVDGPSQPATQPGVGNVTMTGNRAKDGGGARYSGTNIEENFTINGKTPKGGFMVAPAGPVSDAAAAAPSGLGFNPAAPTARGPSVTLIGDGREARDRQQLIDAASTPLRGSPGGQLTANQLRTLAGIQEADQRDATARYASDANNQTDIARTLIGEQGANARAAMSGAVDAGRLDLERQAQGFKTRAATREEKLYEAYDAAKTPEERSAIAQSIRDLSGKSESLRDNFMVVGGGQEYNADAGVMRNVPQRLVDLRTGQEVGGQQQGPAVPRQGEERNGYRFKGGNPADQKNWEKI